MCISPFYIKKNKEQIPVGCGRCPDCKKRRINQWAFRLMEEERVSSSSYFVTLTYKNSTVPQSLNKLMTLNLKDWQNFMKKLRRLDKGKIRYYMAGEYGDKTDRPHYHAIMFNVEEVDNIAKAWSRENHKGIEDVIGEIHIGEVNHQTTAYCAKYIDKPNRIPYHELDDRKPEFSTMSKGIGGDYVKRMASYHRRSINNNYVTFPEGYKVAMPRYYKEKIFTEEEREKRRQQIVPTIEQEEHKRKLAEIEEYKKLYNTTEFTFEDWRREKNKGKVISHNKQTRDGI